MYFPASDIIVRELDLPKETVQKLDNYLANLRRNRFNVTRASTYLGIRLSTVEAIAEQYVKHLTLRRIETYLCPTDGEIVEVFDTDEEVYCSKCEQEYERSECEIRIDYVLRKDSPILPYANSNTKHPDSVQVDESNQRPKRQWRIWLILSSIFGFILVALDHLANIFGVIDFIVEYFQ